MKWPIGVLLVVLVLVLLAAWAGRARAAVDERFEAHEFKGGNGKTLLYRLVKPAGYDASGSEAHPLVIFLHGAGERGDDNRKQLVHGSDMMLAMAGEHGAFVLVPQCPSGEKWADVDWSAPTHKMPEEPSSSMSLVMQLLGSSRRTSASTRSGST